MTSQRRNIVVGLVVLVAILALGWMILRFSSSSAAAWFTSGTEFKIVADQATGVGNGTAVYYLGLEVGRVTSVRRLPNNREVEISVVLNEDESLPKNLHATIRQTSQLGQASALYLETMVMKDGRLVPAPPEGVLESGATVNGEHAGSGIVPAEFTDLARDLREQKLIAHIDEAVIEMRTQLKKAGRLFESADELIGDDQVRADLKATIASVRKTSDNLDRFSQQLETLSGETNKTLRELNERLHQIAVVFDRFQSIAEKIDKGEGTAGLLVNDRRLYDSLVDTSKHMNLTVLDLQRLVQQWEEEGISLKLK